jgi:phytoene dehydrogenase-like protein
MFSSPLLREMILCPVQYYGCAWERDMDWGQFLIMFQSLFLEGFSRPQGGVRTLIKILEDKMRALEIPYSLGEGVEQIQKTDDGFVVQTTKNRTLKVKKIFSSAGHLETLNLVQGFELKTKVNPGPLSFTEVLLVYPQKILKPLVEQTIVFFNQGKTFDYLKPNDFFDAQSGVICFPDNYHQEDREGEGMVRLTFKANFEKWNQLSKSEYNEMKTKVLIAAKKIIQQYFPQITETPLFEDIFTPLTIKKFTSHIDGAVYGSTDKERNGKTTVPNLYLIGTDQGYLGIVGAMLSGISMANLYGLQGES